MPCRRSVPVEIEKGLVDRQRFDQRRQLQHQACGSARPTRGVFRHVRAGSRPPADTARQRLEHRHRRAHAVGARDVAAGRHDTALAAADDQRLVARGADRRAFRPRRRRRRSRHGRWRACRVRDGRGDAASRRPGSARAAPACRRDSRGRVRPAPLTQSRSGCGPPRSRALSMSRGPCRQRRRSRSSSVSSPAI